MAPVAIAAKVHVDGTHRTVDPATTLERLLPVLPKIGVTRVGVITGLDVIGIPVVMVCRPNGRSLSVSQGKGPDLTLAKVSGIMEAAEAWHAEHVLLPLRLATYGELRSVARVVEVEQLPRPSGSRFHPDLSLLWVEGTDVFTAERVWVPFECVHLDFRVPGPQGSGCFLSTGTGLAAGNHQLEAVSHALCEIVERDAMALWEERTADDRASRRLDLEGIDDRCCRGLLDAFERAGVGVVVDDLTTDVGLPVLSATIVDRNGGLLRRLPASSGYGCHPDRGVALARALAEAAQGRLTLISGSRDDCPPAYYRRLTEAKAIATQVRGLGEPARRSFGDVPHVPGESIDADVAHVLDLVRAAGVRQAILVDLTRPDIGIPVVRMVVPGLEGWAEKPDRVVPGERRRALRAQA